MGLIAGKRGSQNITSLQVRVVLMGAALTGDGARSGPGECSDFSRHLFLLDERGMFIGDRALEVNEN
jgi:hypothetical protein